MLCRRKIFGILTRTAAGLLLIFCIGCARAPVNLPVQPVVQPPPLFPPQTAMQSGDYAGFLAANESTLKTCQEPEQCQAALFSLGFLYCYPKSPYYNPVKGIKYFEDLINGSPESPWAYQARVLVELSKKIKVESRKRQPKGDEGKQKETSSSEAGKLIEGSQQVEGQQEKQIESPQERPAENPAESVAEAERRRLEDEVRSRDETIKELNRQIERSRQIDIEIDKKERGLLY